MGGNRNLLLSDVYLAGVIAHERLTSRGYSADRWRARGDLGPQLGALFCNGALNCRAFHLTLVVDNDPSVVLEIDEDSLATPPCFLLPDHNTLQDFLPQLWLAFFAGAKHHVAWAAVRNHVQAPTDALHGEDI